MSELGAQPARSSTATHHGSEDQGEEGGRPPTDRALAPFQAEENRSLLAPAGQGGLQAGDITDTEGAAAHYVVDDLYLHLLAGRPTRHIEVPMAYAAASEDLPLLDEIRDRDIGLTTRVRGRAGDFSITVSNDGKRVRIGVLQIGEDPDSAFLLPLWASRVTISAPSVEGGIRLAVGPGRTPTSSLPVLRK